MPLAISKITQTMLMMTQLTLNQVIILQTPQTLFTTVANPVRRGSLMTHLTHLMRMNPSHHTEAVATTIVTTLKVITSTIVMTVMVHRLVTLTIMIHLELLCTLAMALMTLTSPRTLKFTIIEMDVFHTLTPTMRLMVPHTISFLASVMTALMTSMVLPNTVVPVVTVGTAAIVTIVPFMTTMPAVMITATSPTMISMLATTTPTMDITTSPKTVTSTTSEQIRQVWS